MWLSVRPSAWKNSVPTERIFINFNIWILFENRRPVRVVEKCLCFSTLQVPSRRNVIFFSRSDPANLQSHEVQIRKKRGTDVLFLIEFSKNFLSFFVLSSPLLYRRCQKYYILPAARTMKSTTQLKQNYYFF
jgi:hypothetical protein